MLSLHQRKKWRGAGRERVNSRCCSVLRHIMTILYLTLLDVVPVVCSCRCWCCRVPDELLEAQKLKVTEMDGP